MFQIAIAGARLGLFVYTAIRTIEFLANDLPDLIEHSGEYYNKGKEKVESLFNKAA